MTDSMKLHHKHMCSYDNHTGDKNQTPNMLFFLNFKSCPLMSVFNIMFSIPPMIYFACLLALFVCK